VANPARRIRAPLQTRSVAARFVCDRTRALKRQYILAEMIGSPYDSKQRARWHHPAIVTSARHRSPSSAFQVAWRT
jgi:hypothetical protein